MCKWLVFLILAHKVQSLNLAGDVFSSWLYCASLPREGRLGEAKVSCSFCHQGVQLILAYSWARPPVLAAGKGRGGNVPSLFFHFPHSSLSLSFISSTISSISFLSFSVR